MKEKKSPKKPMDVSDEQLEKMLEDEATKEERAHELGCMGKDVSLKEG
ncbi:MAG: hypothetical protein ACXQS1_04145 [Methermicoccaceae archaeon]